MFLQQASYTPSFGGLGLKRKNLSRYHTAHIAQVSILLAERLETWAQSISISAKRFLFWIPDGLSGLDTIKPDGTGETRVSPDEGLSRLNK